MHNPICLRFSRASHGLRATLLTAALLLPACGQWVWTSSGHAALAPDKIQILDKTPPRYERLGTVTHLYTEGAWQADGDATPIMQDLLKEASAMGSNVLLLVDDTTAADGATTMKYQGKTYTFPVIGKTKTIVAQGIFVPKE